ncbi:uncharacterized protein PFL1_04395 [Pseudozyma flocculosa PF-1]|uniref:Uncharacterized protein n=2 Tax=Pseudozyma flocculosa TaxID=84751 RepID=A0A5C3FD48_9BASI|nr:uncharacterized protein PFL1_04395 [Pseudozyma flocculosa PF-1]EPQ28068.1 hypothetical protein PFL1_04395 [Pseudozyma flocculosa PF-1]SPO42190.1 uncharacterized protein PSFLO_07673 [Pseudozyma flocculosa]
MPSRVANDEGAATSAETATKAAQHGRGHSHGSAFSLDSAVDPQLGLGPIRPRIPAKQPSNTAERAARGDDQTVSAGNALGLETTDAMPAGSKEGVAEAKAASEAPEQAVDSSAASQMPSTDRANGASDCREHDGPLAKGRMPLRSRKPSMLRNVKKRISAIFSTSGGGSADYADAAAAAAHALPTTDSDELGASSPARTVITLPPEPVAAESTAASGDANTPGPDAKESQRQAQEERGANKLSKRLSAAILSGLKRPSGKSNPDISVDATAAVPGGDQPAEVSGGHAAPGPVVFARGSLMDKLAQKESTAASQPSAEAAGVPSEVDKLAEGAPVKDVSRETLPITPPMSPWRAAVDLFKTKRGQSEPSFEHVNRGVLSSSAGSAQSSGATSQTDGEAAGAATAALPDNPDATTPVKRARTLLRKLSRAGMARKAKSRAQADLSKEPLPDVPTVAKTDSETKTDAPEEAVAAPLAAQTEARAEGEKSEAEAEVADDEGDKDEVLKDDGGKGEMAKNEEARGEAAKEDGANEDQDGDAIELASDDESIATTARAAEADKKGKQKAVEGGQ